MITTARDYNSHLHLINNVNPPIYAKISSVDISDPNADNVYNLDINTREIEAPKFLGVSDDHKSETIYFIVDRFADYMDLAETCCVVNYTNAKGKSGIYPVPFYDIFTFAEYNKILIPWVIDGFVTQQTGKVEFSLQFFKIKRETLEDGTIKSSWLYNLNTKSAKSEVLHGMELGQEIGPLDEELVQYHDLLGMINELKWEKENDFGVYWTILPDN